MSLQIIQVRNISGTDGITFWKKRLLHLSGQAASTRYAISQQMQVYASSTYRFLLFHHLLRSFGAFTATILYTARTTLLGSSLITNSATIFQVIGWPIAKAVYSVWWRYSLAVSLSISSYCRSPRSSACCPPSPFGCTLWFGSLTQ